MKPTLRRLRRLPPRVFFHSYRKIDLRRSNILREKMHAKLYPDTSYSFSDLLADVEAGR